MTARSSTVFLKGLLFSLLFCLAAAWVRAQPVTLVTLGDSLTAGDGDETGIGGYPPRLLARLQTTHPGSVLQQFGVSGHTTMDLINIQLDPAVAALNSAPAGNLKIALVWIGSNDLFGFYEFTAQQDWCIAMGIDACEASEFQQSADNVNTILAALQATGATLYIALLDDQSRRPVITDPALRASSFPNITDEYAARMSTQVGVYNSRVQTRAAAHGATTVDFFHTTIFETWATLSDDGNHPNAAGYDAITTIWYNAISGAAPPPPPPPEVPEGVNMAPVLHLLRDRDEREVLHEDFESWPPAGWTVVNNGGDCVWSTNVATGVANHAGGDGMAAAANSDDCGPGTKMNTDLLSPIFDLSMAEEATLSYITSFEDYSFDDFDYAEVSVSTDGGSTWTVLVHWEGVDHSPVGPGEAVTLDLTPYAGTIQARLRFRYYAPAWDFWWMVDQVRVTRE